MAAQKSDNDFERLAAEDRGRGLLGEFWEFLRYNKKWWLTPILLMLLAMGGLLMLAASGVAPVLYTFW